MELSRRALSVLCAVVELHIRSGDPVASRQVARHSGLGLSSATMRSVMAELEEGGYLCRAHSSAGRVPSDKGYRCFVDTMPRRRGPTLAVRRELEGRMAVPGFYDDSEAANQVVKTHEELKAKLKALYQEWEELAQKATAFSA